MKIYISGPISSLPPAQARANFAAAAAAIRKKGHEPGWERSNGAVLERAHANRFFGLHIFETLDEIWKEAPKE